MKESAGESQFKFKVVEVRAPDAGKGIARMEPQDMSAMGLETGDVIIITGRKQAAAKVLPMFPGERISGIVQIDGITRDNAAVAISEFVTLKKGQFAVADSLALRPVSGGILINEGELIRSISGLPLMKGNRLRVNLFGRAVQEYIVEKVSPAETVIVKPTTELSLLKGVETCEESYDYITYEDIGGLSKELHKIREMIELPLKYPELFTRLGIEAPKGVLLYGPPGTGKTLIARAVAHEADAAFIHVSGPEIMHKFYGESEGRLRELFEKAKTKAPSILFLDEIDAIAAKRDEVTGEVEKRVVAQLLASMDGIKSRGQVIVIGATNIPNVLDPALRRPGRFDREIVIGVPGREDRLEILHIHTRGMPLSPNVNLEHLSRVTHGFVGADLQALCREAAFNCLREYLPEIDYSLKKLPDDLLLSLEVQAAHFAKALQEVEPSAIREVMVEAPAVLWSDICGLEKEKVQLREAIDWPLKHPEIYRAYGLEPYKGILMYGSPGTGKTLLAKAVAHETEVNFILINGPMLLSKWVGETEKSIREIFRKARQVAPCIIFFDEVDSLLPRKGNNDHISNRMISQFLTEIDGLVELRGVFILAATNRLELLDPSVIRPGRFDLLIEIPLPDQNTRLEMFNRFLQKFDLERDMIPANLVDLTDQWSGAEIKALCHEACLSAIREKIAQDETAAHSETLQIKWAHFENAYQTIKRDGKSKIKP
ncbi:MAG: CDC48 family AAA ATPase [Bacillota bacterium]